MVVDRLVVRAGVEKRLADSLETALGLSDGLVFAEIADGSEGKKKGEPERVTFSAKFACPVSGFTIDEIEPRLFSFNNPYGACPTCDGLGTTMFFDPELVVPDEKLSLRQGAVAPWANSTSQYYMAATGLVAAGADPGVATAMAADATDDPASAAGPAGRRAGDAATGGRGRSDGGHLGRAGGPANGLSLAG